MTDVPAAPPVLVQPVLVQRSGHVLTVTLNRPAKLNAITPEMYIRLAQAWYEFRDDDSLRVAVLTGAGDRAFSAGADLSTTIPLLSRSRVPADEWEERFVADLSVMNDGLLRDLILDKPVIAAVNGDAFGAGTEMIQASDLRLAVPTARFGLPEVKRGIIPGGGSIARLPRQIPWAQAAQILLLGDPISAAQALTWGLINEVVEPSELPGKAASLAARLAENAPLAVQAIKQGMRECSGLPLADALTLERGLVSRILKTQDAVEGATAFSQKRPPRFSGR